MTEQNAGRASALAHSIRDMFMNAAASTKPVDGGIPAIGIASAIVEAIDTIDPIDLPLAQERALLRCRAIAATMPMLPRNEKEQTHLALLAESGAICASELLRLVETAEVLRGAQIATVQAGPSPTWHPALTRVAESFD